MTEIETTEETAESRDDRPTESADERAARDSLYKLPLRMIPLKTQGVRRAMLVKNVQLHSMIELFADAETGKGHIPIDSLPTVFDAPEDELARDMNVLMRLATLNSFDVYSLRIQLRKLNINVDEHDELSLSDEKKQELDDYMRTFTRPLVRFVYGGESVDPNISIIQLFKNPGRSEALSNLMKFSEKLNVDISEIPAFLEDYGDTFMSLAYFKNCLDLVIPDTYDYITWQNEMQDNYQAKRDLAFMNTLKDIDTTMNYISASITGRFEVFDQKSKTFWDDINGTTFREVRDLIASHHVTIGGVLCGLTVKMLLWRDRFSKNPGGPNRRMEFIRSEIVPGLNSIKELEESAGGSSRR